VRPFGKLHHGPRYASRGRDPPPEEQSNLITQRRANEKNNGGANLPKNLALQQYQFFRPRCKQGQATPAAKIPNLRIAGPLKQALAETSPRWPGSLVPRGDGLDQILGLLSEAARSRF